MPEKGVGMPEGEGGLPRFLGEGGYARRWAVDMHHEIGIPTPPPLDLDLEGRGMGWMGMHQGIGITTQPTCPSTDT